MSDVPGGDDLPEAVPGGRRSVQGDRVVRAPVEAVVGDDLLDLALGGAGDGEDLAPVPAGEHLVPVEADHADLSAVDASLEAGRDGARGVELAGLLFSECGVEVGDGHGALLRGLMCWCAFGELAVAAPRSAGATGRLRGAGRVCRCRRSNSDALPPAPGPAIASSYPVGGVRFVAWPEERYEHSGFRCGAMTCDNAKRGAYDPGRGRPQPAGRRTRQEAGQLMLFACELTGRLPFPGAPGQYEAAACRRTGPEQWTVLVRRGERTGRRVGSPAGVPWSGGGLGQGLRASRAAA
ncbi:hypothetical protein [Streptomyces chartreusis]